MSTCAVYNSCTATLKTHLALPLRQHSRATDNKRCHQNTHCQTLTPSPFYTSGTWTMTEEMKKQLQTTQRRMMRIIIERLTGKSCARNECRRSCRRRAKKAANDAYSNPSTKTCQEMGRRPQRIPTTNQTNHGST